MMILEKYMHATAENPVHSIKSVFFANPIKRDIEKLSVCAG
jgi:hypothetical protein